MIRAAAVADIPALVEMATELHASAGLPGRVECDVAAGTLVRLMHEDGALVLVVAGGDGGLVGFLAAEVVRTAVSRDLIAVEHGWYCRAAGWGGRLLARYEVWARERGCAAIRLSSPSRACAAEAVLARAGYAPAETAWIKGL